MSGVDPDSHNSSHVTGEFKYVFPSYLPVNFSMNT